MQRFNLSDKEKKVLKAQIHFAIQNTDAKTVGELLEKNYSWAETSDLASHANLTIYQIVGVVSSLVKKGILDTRPIKFNPHLIFISDSFLAELDKNLELKSLV